MQVLQEQLEHGAIDTLVTVATGLGWEAAANPKPLRLEGMIQAIKSARRKPRVACLCSLWRAA